MIVFMLTLSSVSVYAEGSENTDKFTDVDETHWAYDYIYLMSDLGIINGYDDGSFKPSATVSRAEFAKMMVLTLDLDTSNPPNTPYFIDVDKSDWEYKYVEAAKGYLTGFTSTFGMKFKSDNPAVREDMAVAIVRGLDLAVDSDNSVLDGYSDADEVSTNLIPYVATAIEEGIMIGSGGEFEPQGNLTRAEAATLLARLLVDEKVVIGEDIKVVIDDFKSDSKTPVLEAVATDAGVVLEWSKVLADNFSYYKVVVSQTSSTPNYPNVGDALPLSGVDNNRYVLESGNSHGGAVLKGGESYYVAITAVYGGEYFTSNVEYVTVPGEYVEPNIGDRTPVLDYEVRNEFDDVLLEWTQVPSDGFKYYKVVCSKSDSSPSYPDDGYAKYISDASSTRWELTSGDSYNGGDVGGALKGGETYYVAITAVYNDGKYTSNVKTITIPGDYEEPDTSERTPYLEASVESNGVELEWTKTSSSNFSYYKVVLSKYDSKPSYPDDGYLVYITDSSDTDHFVQELQSYHGGDFGGTVQDETYYMTITACYSDGKYTSNTVTVTVPSK